MISKQLFKDTLAHMKKMDIMSDELQDVFHKNEKDDFCDGAAFRDMQLESYMLAVLEETMGDAYSFISWWVLETHFGETNPIVIENGHTKDLNTAEDLYDFLTNS